MSELERLSPRRHLPTARIVNRREDEGALGLWRHQERRTYSAIAASMPAEERALSMSSLKSSNDNRLLTAARMEG